MCSERSALNANRGPVCFDRISYPVERSDEAAPTLRRTAIAHRPQPKRPAPRSTRQRHQSASNQPKLILKLPGSRPELRDTADCCSIGLGEAQ